MTSVFDEPIPDSWGVTVCPADKSLEVMRFADVKNTYIQNGTLHIYFNNGLNAKFFNMQHVYYYEVRAYYSEDSNA